MPKSNSSSYTRCQTVAYLNCKRLFSRPLIGYARVSTEDQTPLPQSEALQSAGCAEIFEEHASGGNRARPVLARVLERVQNGDTLVVDVHGFNGQAWFDRAGNFASSALHVVERYTPMGPNALMYEATIEDPNVFTAPWTIRMPLYRRLEENVQVLEFKCVEFTEDLIYGHLRKEPTR